MTSAPASIADLIRARAADRPETPALVAGDSVRSYAQLHDESSRVAQALLDAGVAPGDRVAFLGKNVPEYFTLLFGAGKVNAVTVAVNWRLAAPEMAYILDHADAKVLFVGEEFLGHVEKMELEREPRVVVLGDSDRHPSYDDWISGHDPVDPAVPVAPGDTCYQLYTSGTTGRPKGVELSNSNFFGMLPVVSRAWEFDADSVSLVAMPLFHIAGSGWALVGLYSGATNVLLRDVDPAEIVRLVPAHGITNALFVPAVIQFLLGVPNLAEADFSSLRCVVYGASPISEQVLVGGMKALGARFCQVYGLTETTGAVTQLGPEDHDPGGARAHLLRSAGKPLPGVEVRIAGEAGEPLPDGEVGEIWIRSRQNLKAYWSDPAATEGVYPEGRDESGLGWFRTGDAGYLEDGYLFIHDRVKDMIVSGGENVYPAEIENVLMSHPSVADAAVIGVPHEKWGETVKAVVVLAEGADPSCEPELLAWCRERLAGFKCPTSTDFVPALPRNPSGKILKTELRKPYWEGRERMVN